jgi:enoyl-CoA hydratase
MLKPLLAAVQGACIAGGLMLAWACHLIVSTEDTFFQDPVGGMGIPRVECSVHRLELPPRVAKELILLGALNIVEDLRGKRAAMNAVFNMHHFGHGQIDLVNLNNVGGIDAKSMALPTRSKRGRHRPYGSTTPGSLPGERAGIAQRRRG